MKKTYKNKMSQNCTIDPDAIWVNCEFTNCCFPGGMLLTQNVLDYNPKIFKNCIETNELHTNEDKLPEYVEKRKRQDERKKTSD